MSGSSRTSFRKSRIKETFQTYKDPKQNALGSNPN